MDSRNHAINPGIFARKSGLRTPPFMVHYGRHDKQKDRQTERKLQAHGTYSRLHLLPVIKAHGTSSRLRFLSVIKIMICLIIRSFSGQVGTKLI